MNLKELRADLFAAIAKSNPSITQDSFFALFDTAFADAKLNSSDFDEEESTFVKIFSVLAKEKKPTQESEIADILQLTVKLGKFSVYFDRLTTAEKSVKELVAEIKNIPNNKDNLVKRNSRIVLQREEMNVESDFYEKCKSIALGLSATEINLLVSNILPAESDKHEIIIKRREELNNKQAPQGAGDALPSPPGEESKVSAVAAKSVFTSAASSAASAKKAAASHQQSSAAAGSKVSGAGRRKKSRAVAHGRVPAKKTHHIIDDAALSVVGGDEPELSDGTPAGTPPQEGSVFVSSSSGEHPISDALHQQAPAAEVPAQVGAGARKLSDAISPSTSPHQGSGVSSPSSSGERPAAPLSHQQASAAEAVVQVGAGARKFSDATPPSSPRHVSAFSSSQSVILQAMGSVVAESATQHSAAASSGSSGSSPVLDDSAFQPLLGTQPHVITPSRRTSRVASTEDAHQQARKPSDAHVVGLSAGSVSTEPKQIVPSLDEIKTVETWQDELAELGIKFKNNERKINAKNKQLNEIYTFLESEGNKDIITYLSDEAKVVRSDLLKPVESKAIKLPAEYELQKKKYSDFLEKRAGETPKNDKALVEKLKALAKAQDAEISDLDNKIALVDMLNHQIEKQVEASHKTALAHAKQDFESKVSPLVLQHVGELEKVQNKSIFDVDDKKNFARIAEVAKQKYQVNRMIMEPGQALKKAANESLRTRWYEGWFNTLLLGLPNAIAKWFGDRKERVATLSNIVSLQDRLEDLDIARDRQTKAEDAKRQNPSGTEKQLLDFKRGLNNIQASHPGLEEKDGRQITVGSDRAMTPAEKEIADQLVAVPDGRQTILASP